MSSGREKTRHFVAGQFPRKMASEMVINVREACWRVFSQAASVGGEGIRMRPIRLALSSVQFSRSVMHNSLLPHGPQASLSITNSWSLLRLMSIYLVMPYSHLILCHPLILSSSIFPSIRVFSTKSVLRIRWPKYWSFSFSISPSNEYSRLISLRFDWLYLLAVQGTLKSLLQHHSSKASIL